MKVIQNDDGFTIESIEGIEMAQTDKEFEEAIQQEIEGALNKETLQIEGWGSFFKKAFKKVSKIGKFASKMGVLPPGTGFGLDMLNKLASSKKTRKTKMGLGAVSYVYKAAYLKGVEKGLRSVELYIKSQRR